MTSSYIGHVLISCNAMSLKKNTVIFFRKVPKLDVPKLDCVNQIWSVFRVKNMIHILLSPMKLCKISCFHGMSNNDCI